MPSHEYPSRSLRLLLALATGAACLLLGAGCAERKAAPVKLRFAWPTQGTTVNAQLALVLERTDILPRHGFTPEVRRVKVRVDASEALRKGEADVALVSASAFVPLLAEGFDATAVASVGSDGHEGLVVKPGSAIGSLEDLKGRSVGAFFGICTHKSAIDFVKSVGLVPGADVRLVDTRGRRAMRQAFLSGEVDALMDWDPYLTLFAEKGVYRVVHSVEMDSLVIAAAGFLQANRGSAQRLRAALGEAVAYMLQHKQVTQAWAAEHVARELPEMTRELIGRISEAQASYRRDPAQIDLAVSEREILKMEELAEYWSREGVIRSRPPIRPHVLPP